MLSLWTFQNLLSCFSTIHSAKIQDPNSELFNHLHQINAQKLGQLIGPQIISDSSPENFKTVVTIPEN